MAGPNNRAHVKVTGTELMLGSIVVILSVMLWALISTARQDTSPPEMDRVMSRSELITSQLIAARTSVNFTNLRGWEQIRVHRTLARHLTEVDEWALELNREDIGILCLGENHGRSVRSFLSERFFPFYEADRLFLEISPEGLNTIERAVDRGRGDTELLGADVAGIIQAARSTNPNVELVGLEGPLTATESELTPSREFHRAQRFWQHHRPGERHVLLFGGLHCADQNLWMYRLLRESAPTDSRAGMRSVRLAGIEQHAVIAAFAEFVQGLGLAGDSFVVHDTATLREDWMIRYLFPLLVQQFMDPFDVIVIYPVNQSPPAQKEIRPILPGQPEVRPQLRETRLLREDGVTALNTTK